MKIKIIKHKNLSRSYFNLINKTRVREWGDSERKNKKDFEPDTKWFFVKDGRKVVSFGGLRPIKINYLGRKYNINGICSIISIEKGKGYGKVLVKAMINYLKKNGKTGLGFTLQTKFFEKTGLKAKKNFIQRFVYINPKTGKKTIDNEGDGIYYNGKDNFVSKVLKTKEIVYIPILHW